MSKSSEAVKNWRRKTKDRIINAMGGKCQICGYSKCSEALELHHIDPNEKELSFSKIRANPKSWATVVAELRKSILLCAICHREIHYGLVTLPDTYQKFDEIYSDYRGAITEDRYCKVCETKLTLQQDSCCSRECLHKSMLDRPGRDFGFDWSNLYDLKFNQKLTNVAIAEIIGCSETSVRKKLRTLILAPRVGLEPTTKTLTAFCSTN